MKKINKAFEKAPIRKVKGKAKLHDPVKKLQDVQFMLKALMDADANNDRKAFDEILPLFLQTFYRKCRTSAKRGERI